MQLFEVMSGVKKIFVDRMKLVDEMIIDQSPIADRFASRYSEKFNIKV